MSKKTKTAVLLHGITRSDLDMKIIEKSLMKSGYDSCLNIKYPSTKHDLDTLCDMIYERLQSEESFHNADQVDFVAHSMGGLLTRYIIAKYRPDNLGSVVMLGTPNQGSEMADFLADHDLLAPVFHFIFGPAGNQLRTNVTHFEDEVIDYPLGIIASDASLNPIGNKVFGGPNDTLVSTQSTIIEGMSDHIIVKSPHAVMMFDPRIVKQIIEFLENGRFDHPPKPENPLAPQP